MTRPRGRKASWPRSAAAHAEPAVRETCRSRLARWRVQPTFKLAMVALRADPRQLVPAARAMYEAGKTRSEVLAAIYGVDLPREAALIHRDFVEGKKPLRVLWRAHPWELMIPLEDGGPQFMLGELDYRDEVRAFRQVPHILPVAWLRYSGVPKGYSLIGYDLEEVAAGRATVVALHPRHDEVPENGAAREFERIGESLLDVFACMVRAYMDRWDRDTREDAEERRDAGVELAGVEALRAELR